MKLKLTSIKRTYIHTLLGFSLLGVMTLSSCSSDDDNESNEGIAALVSDTAPKKGWSSTTMDGIVTYRPVVYDDDEIQEYYAISFENGICKNAVYNLVCPNESMAKQLETMLKDGSWAEMDEEEDDDYAKAFAPKKAKNRLRAIQSRSANINTRDLGFVGIGRNGKVVYCSIKSLQSLNSNDVYLLVSYWSPEGGRYTEIVPNKIIVGTWNESTGKYTNNNLWNMGINYEIDTSFENNLLTKYITTMTFPNTTWAQLMYEEVESTNRYIGELSGIYPEATLQGTTVKEKAVIGREVTKEEILQMIAVVDWNLSKPLLTSFFDD